PAEGKTLAVPTRHAEIAAIVVGAPTPDTLGLEAEARPDLVTLADVDARLDSLSPVLGAAFPRRLVHVPAQGGATRAAYVQRMAALRRADVAVAMARWRLQQQLDAYAARIAVTQNLRSMLATENERLTAVGQTLAATRDSLARLVAAITETQARLKGILASEAEATRALAAENIARMDSIGATMRGIANPEDESVLQVERTTAARYQQLSETIAAGLDSAFAHHPVTVARDTVQARLARDEQLLAETQGGVVEANRILGEELARLQAGEPDRVRAGRATLARAEGQRTAEEGALVAAVDAELRARAGQLLAVLRRDTEAAEFGAASAAFFKAAEGTGAATPDGTSPTAGGTAGGVRDEAPNASPSSKPIPPRQ
ncbi:MAG TPA: hypothetical protein VFS05_03855, partial [Gemmatimonadaceae bacterium]|nr:hypothetical protein [Gemmatimonadaceae bacterium]